MQGPQSLILIHIIYRHTYKLFNIFTNVFTGCPKNYWPIHKIHFLMATDIKASFAAVQILSNKMMSNYDEFNVRIIEIK